MENNTPRKNNRLLLDTYRNNNQMYYLTICSFNRNKYFIKDSIINTLLNQLRITSKKFNFSIWAYTFMPDHFHTLVSAEQKNNDLIKFVKAFKQISGFYFKKETDLNLWQKSFYDHVLRTDEDIFKIVKYILENPVRAGLVKNFLDYPYSGSFLFSIKDIIQ